MLAVQDLLEADEDELIDELCVVVDWREYDESIIRDLGEAIGEDLSPEWHDSELWFKWKGWQYRVPLTESMADRYVTIGSVGNVLKGKYEIRLHKLVLEDDTHSLLVLPRHVWKKLDKQHAGWVRSNFVKLIPGKDYFGGGKVPVAG